jgi:hypothetical protein
MLPRNDFISLLTGMFSNSLAYTYSAQSTFKTFTQILKEMLLQFTPQLQQRYPFFIGSRVIMNNHKQTFRLRRWMTFGPGTTLWMSHTATYILMHSHLLSRTTASFHLYLLAKPIL